jgi:predicted lipoprotein
LIRLLVGLLLASALWAGSCHAETDQTAIAKASLTEVIRPSYAALAAATGSLDDKVAALCKQPSAAALQAAKDAFAGAVDAWSKVEIFRFGPIVQDRRYERLFYWPDPKGIGLRQVQDALAKRDEDLTLPYELSAKSVALQGLPALEYLLYGDGAEALTETDHVTVPSLCPKLGGQGLSAAPLLRASPPMSIASPKMWSRAGARALPTRRHLSDPPPRTLFITPLRR